MQKFLILFFSAPFLQTFPPHFPVDCSCKPPKYGPLLGKRRKIKDIQESEKRQKIEFMIFTCERRQIPFPCWLSRSVV